MSKYYIYVVILCSLLPVKLFAQQADITGMWYGELTIIDTQNVRLPYEIAVSEGKGKLSGYARIVFHVNGKDEAGVQNIIIRRKGNDIKMEDEDFVAYNFSIKPSPQVKKKMNVVLTITATEMIMEGIWSTNFTRYHKPYKGTVLLKRKIDFKKLDLFKSLDTLNLASALSFINRPETEVVIAVAVEKKPEPLPVVPEPEPVFIATKIEKVSAGSLAVTKKIQTSRAKIVPPSHPKRAPIDSALLARLSVPVVVVAAPPIPEKKLPPPPKPEPEKKPVVVVVQAPPVKISPPPPPPKPQPEKKIVAVAVQPQPKPPPPPVAILAPSIVHGAAEIEKRVTKSDQSLYFQSDSLLLTLYDNGEVDGDIVTVLMNGNVIFSKAALTTTANSKTIYITPDMDSVKLVMYAENLGSIAPNTGLLIVNDGEQKYYVRFTADLQTNAGILLRRKKN